MIKCPYCDREFESYNGLSKHVFRFAKHETTKEQLLADVYQEGKIPKCKCGCGEDAPIIYHNGMRFGEYLRGHISRVKNNWGHNDKAIKNSAKTRRNQFKEGTREQWNKGKSWDETYDEETQKRMLKAIKSEERSKKLSKKLKGKKNTPEQVKNFTKLMREYWLKEENKERQRKNTLNRMHYRKLNELSKLESFFKKLLDDNNIEYEIQYPVNEINAFYDFKLKETNILIEVDGDFYHCNPNTEWAVPKYEMQVKNLLKERIKNNWANDNNYILLRFWESDIYANPEQIIKKIKKTLIENM